MAKKAKSPKKTAKRTMRAPKSPYTVMLGRVSKDGKKYLFDAKDKHLFNTKSEARKAANDALDDDGDDIREILIIVNPEAKV